MRGQRSNQLNYVPNLFSYLYRKPACLVAFLRFNRFACVALSTPQNQIPGLMDTMDAKLNRDQNCAAGEHRPRAAVPAPSMNCSRGNSSWYRFRPSRAVAAEIELYRQGFVARYSACYWPTVLFSILAFVPTIMVAQTPDPPLPIPQSATIDRAPGISARCPTREIRRCSRIRCLAPL